MIYDSITDLLDNLNPFDLNRFLQELNKIIVKLRDNKKLIKEFIDILKALKIELISSLNKHTILNYIDNRIKELNKKDD